MNLDDLKKKYEKAPSWRARIYYMVFYHKACCIRDHDWTLRDTAKDFGVSIGLVSENLRLGNKYTLLELKDFKFRKDAVKTLDKIL